MPETRHITQIEFDNPGFGVSRRYNPDGVDYSIFYTDSLGISRHVHCRSLDAVQPLIDRLRTRHSRTDEAAD